MSEGNEPKKKSSEESRAECSSPMRTSTIDADLDHMNLSPMIRHLVENMTEEHWIIVREALCVPRTREEVYQLCAGIVVRVVRTARYYLIPALSEVLAVPAAHVILYGTKRLGTSEAKNAEESCLGEGPQRITYERPLAAAKKEMDGILPEPVRIVSGLPSAVPTLGKEPKSEASGLSSSIPLLNQLTDTDFQGRATKRVSEILLKNLDNDSCPESPAGVSVEDHDDDEEEEDDESNAKVESQTNVYQFQHFIPSDHLSLCFADDLVGEVIESMNETVSSQDYQVAAFDIVGYVAEEMKDLVEITRGIGAISVKKIWTTSQRMFSAIKNVVGNLFSKSAYSDRQEETTMAYARDVICDVIISMQSDLPDFRSAENLEQAALVNKILGAMLNEVQMIDIKIDKDRPQSHRLPSPSSADSEGNDQNRLRDTPDSPEVPIKGISPVLLCSSVGMKDSSLSRKCSHEAITHVVDTIFESEKRVTITRRLEEFMSDTKMMEYSHNVAGEVQKLLRNHGVQTISVPVGKSLSDSVLYKLQPRTSGKNESPSGFIYGFVEEAVKRLVLSSLFPSISSSSSEEFGSTVDVFTQVMTQVVMETLSTQSQDNVASSCYNTDDIKELVKDEQKLSDKQAQDTKTPSFTSSSDDVLPHIFDEHGERGTYLSHLNLLESNSNNYASLVSMLVIQLLKKINSLHQNIDQNTLPDDILDMSNDLIGEILNELNTTFGIRSDGRYPQEVNIHQIFRVIYKELTQDFGSENMLCSALKSQSPSLTSSLVEKLTKTIVKTCSHPSTSASACLPPSQAIGPQKKKEEKTRNNMFPFRMKMPTFNWKKSRSGELKDSPVAKTSSSRVQANEILSELRESPVSAGPLEVPQEEATVGCCFFRIPKFKLSFKKLMRGAKVAHCDYVNSIEENNNVPGCATSSHEIQLEKATAELTASEGPIKPEETVPGLANASSVEI